MLTVACLLVRGPYAYTPEYVVRLQRMVRRHLSRPYQFVCLTDQPEDVLNAGADEDVSVVRVESLAGIVPPNGVGYWNKLRLFDPQVAWPGRVLYLDLDTLVVSSLDPIMDFPATLALTEDAFVVERAHLDSDRYGRTLVRRFNSSVMVWDGGTHHDLWTGWTPEVAQRLSTDQDWIGEQAADAKGMPLVWFPRISHLVRDEDFAAGRGSFPTDAIVPLCKKPKNHQAVVQWPWLDRVWGGWAA